PLSERVKTDINKNNFNDVLADISPSVRLNVENTLAGARAFRRSAEV
ncbi:TPA: type VI secretion system contractile sheath small subunit, partial [Escherichia coli]|nr:type VI secretion system contractile sheath small subunit [Escherichia coli]